MLVARWLDVLELGYFGLWGSTNSNVGVAMVNKFSETRRC